MLDSKGFDLWSGDYDRTVDSSDEADRYPFAGYKKLMNIVYGTVMDKAPAQVLDIGIGTATLAKSLWQEGNAVTGLDFSPEMLKEAAQKMPGARLIECDFAKGLPRELCGERFDFIVSTYALHHLEDGAKASFLRELLTHLKPGGVILIGDVSFLSREAMSACRDAAGDEWDEDEYYFIYAELAVQLAGECEVSYQQVSHCAGILRLSAK